MDYVNDKLQGFSYFQLSHLLEELKRDKKAFKINSVDVPKGLQSLINKTLAEIEKRAELIPTEKVQNDLQFNYTLI